ncbi:MAG: Gfo/Idh/MocA family oxidoreductase, partial [Actinobacteria bacterium]|nr:Gfo/Idh/MocA family oxidoreductase [Actinomycetota bacterium]
FAVTDINKDVGIKKAKKWNTAFYKNAEEIINDERIDVIFILSPLETHYYYAKKAINHNKHVLVEKPVSLIPNEIKDLYESAKVKKVICMPGHSYAYLPELKRIIEYVRSGLIKKPMYVFMSEIYRMPFEFIKLYHGPLIEVLWHAIYLMISILEIPEKINAFSSCIRKKEMSNVDDQVIVNAKFNNGSLMQIFISWVMEDEASDSWKFKVKVLGEDSCINFSGRNVVNGILNNKPPWNYPLYDEMFEREVDYFINDCVLQDKNPLSSIKDAYYTSIILNAVLNSISENKVVDLKEYMQNLKLLDL